MKEACMAEAKGKGYKESYKQTSNFPVMEAFYTLQGEGFHHGRASYFIRLGGCDVGCVWCDVKESWDAKAHPTKDITEIVNLVKEECKSDLIIITGGEPLMYDCSALVAALQLEGFKVHVETSGVYPAKSDWDWICLSPKKFMKPDASIFPLAHELKVVIFHKSDLEWAESFVSKVNPNCKLYLQPEWSKRKEILPILVEYVKNNPKWTASLQNHKYMDIP